MPSFVKYTMGEVRLDPYKRLPDDVYDRFLGAFHNRARSVTAFNGTSTWWVRMLIKVRSESHED